MAGNTHYVRFLVALTPPDVPVAGKDSHRFLTGQKSLLITLTSAGQGKQ